MRRNTLIDGLKVVASQSIVLHHLSTYGPLSDVWDAAATGSSDWFFEYGRMAVQVFLVIGGFLAARGLALITPLDGRAALLLVAKRYLRLALPLVAALAIAVFSSMLARQWSNFLFFPAAPTWEQFWSHALLIQTITGASSLSAGVWYVAIDFQLYILIVALVWLGRKWAPLWILVGMLASLLLFNLNPELDKWGIYFFGAYAMGSAAYWAATSRYPHFQLGLLCLVGLVALAVDFRVRIALALGIALMLGLFHNKQRGAANANLSLPNPKARWMAMLANSSYALFLVHFSVVMLGNALYAKLGLDSTLSAANTIVGCWSVSMGLALLFEKWIERPIHRRLVGEK